ncbi:MAG: lipoyl(octanoyl) transferase LipB [Planctomycetes bacterium]|nr:lipoyl(octanoyl) transferase LipB [Planctomycetota bacterium]
MFTTDKKIEAQPICIQDCGLTDYRTALQQQLQLRDKRQKNQIPNSVLITEHYPVITLGARKAANKFLTDRSSIEKQNIDIVDIRRGGGITAHNPGQLVFYPIMNLQQLGLGISEYIRKLEQIGSQLLTQLGIGTQTKKDFPGLWVNSEKIASIGVRVSKFITYHGMAINIQNDLSIFDLFVPCGLDNVKMTSALKQTGKNFQMNQVKQHLSSLLIKHFSSEELVEYENHT